MSTRQAQLRIILLCIFIGITAIIDSIHAQEIGLFRLRQWNGSMLFRMQREKRFAPDLNRERAYSGRFTLHNSGYIITPDLFNFEWSGDIGLFLQQFISQDIRRNTRGRLLGHNLTAALFQSNPKSLVFLWNQNTNIITLDEEGRTSYDISTLQATLSLLDIWLPSRLHIAWRDLQEEWHRGSFSAKRNQLRRSIKFSGKRDAEDTIINVDYDFFDVLDRIRTSSSYGKHTAYFRLRHAFGQNQANKLDSKLSLFARYGFNNHQNLRLNQSLILEHRPSLSSQYSHSFTLAHSRVTGTSVHNTAYAAILHSLYASLNSNLGIGGSYATMRDGHTYTYSISGGLSYSKKIPLSGSVHLGYTQGYSVNDNQIDSSEKVVVGERHLFIGGFPALLNERNIIESTIDVYDGNGQTLYEEGEDKDYIIRTVGDRVEIHRNIFGRIPVDELILVDYHFLTLPAMRFSTNSRVFNAGLNFGWLTFSYSINQHDQDLLKGEPQNQSSLQDLYTRSAQMKITLRGNSAGTSLFAEHKIYKSNTLDFNAVDLRYACFLRPWNSLTFSNSFAVSLLTHNLEKLKIDIYALRSELSWRPSRAFLFRGYGKYRIRRETFQPEERNFEYGGTIQRFWRILRLLIRYEKRLWDFGPQTINERRFTLEIERIF